jgi:uncharacterized protein YqhQ
MMKINIALKLLIVSAVRAMGGQAVINGVMMRGEEKYAVAVRRMDESIDVKTFDVPTFAKKFQKVPFLRGVMMLGEAMALGYRALMHSANLQMKDEETRIAAEEAGLDISPAKLSGEELSFEESSETSNPVPSDSADEEKPLSKWVVGISVIFSIVFFVSMFKVGPLLFANWIRDIFGLTKWSGFIVESVFRLSLFIGYLYIISLAKDIKRVFQYHGAEHKAIAAYENDVVLTPQAAQQFTTAHVRCGTNFLLIVMVMSVFFYAGVELIFPDLSFLWILFSRIFGIVVLAGVSYEIIRAASFKMGNFVTRAIVWPGLQLQKVTTRAPSDDQCEVAIVSLKAVFSTEQTQEVESRTNVAAQPSWQILEPISS